MSGCNEFSCNICKSPSTIIAFSFFRISFYSFLKGAPNCLQGLVFVPTGVLESLDREETSELIKKYGGKVTSSLSRNTTYLLVGNEPGESKMKKASLFGSCLFSVCFIRKSFTVEFCHI